MDNSFFPIRFEMHIVLALLALLVFGMQFIRYRRPHHLILALALPCTLLPYLSDSQQFFYAVGIGEAVALIVAFVLGQISAHKEEAEERAAEEAEEAENAEGEDAAEDAEEEPEE